jgi:serpin B
MKKISFMSQFLSDFQKTGKISVFAELSEFFKIKGMTVMRCTTWITRLKKFAVRTASPALPLVLAGVLAVMFPAAVRSTQAAALSGEKDSHMEVQALAEAGNAFGLDLYAELSNRRNANLFLSPISLHTALGMTGAGARGGTGDQMRRVLHSGEKPGSDASAVNAMMDTLNNPRTLEGEPAYQLSIANALWIQKNYPLQPAFTAVARDRYRAKVSPVDFLRADAACRTINKWVAGETADKIREIISPRLISNLTRLVLTNAIYFKSAWENPFNKDATQEKPFYRMTGDTLQTPMMHQQDRFGYLESESLQLLEMPYKGGDLSMIILLPRDREGLNALEAGLTPIRLDAWLREIRSEEVTVTFPRFRFTTDSEISDILKSLGMTEAFDPEKADFSGMTTAETLFISAVLHKAFIAVDEEGTEAAAATAVAMVATAMPIKKEPKVFTADHPFVFMIRHRETGSILFLGRLFDPSAT